MTDKEIPKYKSLVRNSKGLFEFIVNILHNLYF